VAAHAVARDTDSARVQLRESLENNLWQLLSDIAVHVIALVVGSLGSINIETRAGTKVISIILAFDVQTTYQQINSQNKTKWPSNGSNQPVEGGGKSHTRTGIRIQHSNTLLTGTMLEKALL
jgi:hypothetical protein